MLEERERKNIPSQTPTVALKLPGFSVSFTGFLAIVPLAIVFSLIVLVVYLIGRTQSVLCISAVLWIVFIGYWSAVAGNAATTRSSESVGSRQLHQLLMYGALVYAILSDCGEVHLAGSYALGLMVWRDLDIHLRLGR